MLIRMLCSEAHSSKPGKIDYCLILQVQLSRKVSVDVNVEQMQVQLTESQHVQFRSDDLHNAAMNRIDIKTSI